MASNRMQQGVAIAMREWPLFAKEPIWCSQFLAHAERFLLENGTFRGAAVALSAMGSGLQRPASVAQREWWQGTLLLMKMGWALPLDTDYTNWMSLIQGQQS